MTKFRTSTAPTSLPATSSAIQSDGAATESGRVRDAGFQRKPGLLTSLRNAFGRLKAMMDQGGARKQVGQALQHCSVQKQATAMGNVRDEGMASRKAGQRSRPASAPNRLLIRPEDEKRQNMARHERVLTAMKTSPASHFNRLERREQMQVLNALDVCAGLSDETSREGLMMLSDCIVSLKKSAAPADSGRRTSGSGGLAHGDLASISRECEKRLKQDAALDELDQLLPDLEQAVSQGHADAALAELDQLLPDLEQAVGRAAPQAVATPQPDELDQLVGELAKSMGPTGAPSPSLRPVDPASVEMDDLDQLAADIARSLRDSTDIRPASGTPHAAEGTPLAGKPPTPDQLA